MGSMYQIPYCLLLWIPWLRGLLLICKSLNPPNPDPIQGYIPAYAPVSTVYTSSIQGYTGSTHVVGLLQRTWFFMTLFLNDKNHIYCLFGRKIVLVFSSLLRFIYFIWCIFFTIEMRLFSFLHGRGTATSPPILLPAVLHPTLTCFLPGPWGGEEVALSL